MSIGERWFKFFDKPVPNLLLRLIVMFFGLACVAFSVALSRATGLGVSTISAIPGVLSFATPISIGTFTFAMNMLFILAQIMLLRRDYHPLQLLCIPFVGVFAAIIDFFVPICQLFPMPNYLACLAWALLCCPITAFGVWIQVKAALVMLPGDGIVQAISAVFDKNFGKCKLVFDMSNLIIGAVLSLVLMGMLQGVREGTLFLALLTGPIIKKLNELFPSTERFMPTKGHLTLTAASKEEGPEVNYENEELPLVITIGREYGSGGRELAQAIGDRLEIPVYDHSLIDMTARETGLTLAYVREHEQELRHGILYNLYAQQYAYIGKTAAIDDELFLAQARTITNLATHSSCVIVGRNANAILAEREHVFSVFVKAPIKQRIERVCKRDGLSSHEALTKIKQVDAERREHARTFLNSEWGKAGYDLIVDSSKESIPVLADNIVKAVQAKQASL